MVPVGYPPGGGYPAEGYPAGGGYQIAGCPYGEEYLGGGRVGGG